MTTPVDTSYGILFDVRSEVSRSVTAQYHTRSSVSKSFSLESDIRARVSKSASLVYDVRKTISPVKVVILLHSIRKAVSKFFSVGYGVRVPISSFKEVEVKHDTRFRVAASPCVVQYDTEIVGSEAISKSVVIKYHTLVTTDDEIITVPIERDAVPPQVITTASL